MRTLIAASLLLAAAPLAAQDPDRAVAGGGSVPDGWHVTLDRANANAADVRFVRMGDGYHVTMGPAAVLWNPANAATGEYRARATFAQTRAPTHPEAYGLVLAGKNLDGTPPNGPDYIYFLVRGDGKYMVRHRAGSGDLHDIVQWTEHPAIARQDEQGRATNALAAEAGASGLRLMVNGQQVAEFLKADVPYLNTDGIAALRVNHNLDVHVSGFAVEKKQ